MTTRAMELADEIDATARLLVDADQRLQEAQRGYAAVERKLWKLLDEVRALKLAPTPDGEPEPASSTRAAIEAGR
jgi:hypothetical protein